MMAPCERAYVEARGRQLRAEAENRPWHERVVARERAEEALRELQRTAPLEVTRDLERMAVSIFEWQAARR